VAAFAPPLRGRAISGIGAVVVPLVMAAAAYAFLTVTGIGSGAAPVGTAADWSVTGADGTGHPSSTGLMYAGGSQATLTYRITNAGSGHQGLDDVTVVFATATDANGDTVVVDDATGAQVPGCLARWFSVGETTLTPALPADLAGGGSVTGSTHVALANDGSSQDACAGANPRLTVTAN
jgi:hypothetical protein